MPEQRPTTISEHEAIVTNQNDEISLLALLVVLAKYKWLVVGLPLVTGLLAAFYAVSLPDVYTATTKILPPQASQSSAAGLLSQLGGLAGLGLGGFGASSKGDLYTGMLKSRRIADGMIKRLDLNTVFQQKLQSDTQGILQGMTRVVLERDGMISVEVDDTDPKRAAVLANAYIDELHILTKSLALTEASQRRLFFESQLALAKENLAKSEAAAKQSLEKGGIFQVEGQGRSMLGVTANLRGQIAIKEVQIGAMRSFASEANPDLYRAQQELESMKRELAKMEGYRTNKAKENSVAGDSQGSDSLTLLRDVRYYEAITEALVKQFEVAKLDEAKEAATIQVLDRAVVPDRRSKPNRSQLVLWCSLIALIVGVLVAFIVEAIFRARTDPEQMDRLFMIKRSLSWRRI